MSLPHEESIDNDLTGLSDLNDNILEKLGINIDESLSLNNQNSPVKNEKTIKEESINNTTPLQNSNNIIIDHHEVKTDSEKDGHSSVEKESLKKNETSELSDEELFHKAMIMEKDRDSEGWNNNPKFLGRKREDVYRRPYVHLDLEKEKVEVMTSVAPKIIQNASIIGTSAIIAIISFMYCYHYYLILKTPQGTSQGNHAQLLFEVFSVLNIIGIIVSIGGFFKFTQTFLEHGRVVKHNYSSSEILGMVTHKHGLNRPLPFLEGVKLLFQTDEMNMNHDESTTKQKIKKDREEGTKKISSSKKVADK